MLFRQLEYLAALARERHFARAAEACGVTQPSLSEAIRKLEEELQIPLIERGRRFDGLTAEGERVVMWAQQILADRNALTDDVEAMRTGLGGRVRVGTVPTASSMVPHLVESLTSRHPLLNVQVATDLTSRDALAMLRDHSLDAALTYVDDEARAAFRVVPLYREKYVLLARAAIAPAGGTAVPWEEAARLPLCLLNPAMQGRRRIDACFAESGIEATARVETDSFASLIAHVATSRWAGIVPVAWLHALGVPVGLRVLPLAETVQAAQIGLVAVRRDPESVMVHALLSAARGLDLLALEHLPSSFLPSVTAGDTAVRHATC
ncbi:LysR family transcriptional regulator [Streptomyces sp. NPDC004721]